jgi:hypothetical protein
MSPLSPDPDPTGSTSLQALVDGISDHGPTEPTDLRTDRAHPARMYDYYLGGKDNFPADRVAAEQALTAFPNLRITAQQNRAFLRRAAAYLAQKDILQFLDIGTGIPTSPNLHEVTQRIAPQTRVVYTDSDPIVLAHARALLTSTPEGRTTYLDADIREPEKILRSAEVVDTLDLTRPVALSLVAILHFLTDKDAPGEVVRRLVDALPVGSYLMLSHITADFAPNEMAALVATYEKAGIATQARSRDEIAAFFDGAGLHLADPGIQPCQRWHPEESADSLPHDAAVSCYAAVGIKP